MKKYLAFSIVALAGAFGPGLANLKAAVQFSAGIEISAPADFYDPLADNGAWVEVGSYGRCWHPARVEADWRPYAEGHWEWTDVGWYWVSDEPWAWACYHYGSWVDDPRYGWVWIPGTEWGPSWVTWRQGPDHIGWAPCGPRGVVPAPSLFIFVDIHHFHDRFEPRSFIVNNTTIINRTKVINNISRETRDFDGTKQRVVVNRGPSVDVVQKATGARFAAQPIREIARQTPVPQTVRRSEATPRGSANQGQTRNNRQPAPTAQRELPASVKSEPRPLAPRQAETRQPLEPSGRAQPRTYQPSSPGETAPSVKTPPVTREKPTVNPQPIPERRPTTVPPEERNLTPTPRERTPQQPPQSKQVGPAREREPVREAPPRRPEEEKAKGRDREKDQP